MGYDASLKIKEYDKSFHSYFTEADEETADAYKNRLIGFCLVGSGKDVPMEKTIKELRYYINLYVGYLTEWWKMENEKKFNNAETDADGYHEMDFRGWQYSDRGHQNSTVDDIKKLIFDELFLLCLIPTPNRFGDDKEKDEYWEKVTDIKEHLDDIPDTIWDILDAEFFFFYKDKEDTVFDESY